MTTAPTAPSGTAVPAQRTPVPLADLSAQLDGALLLPGTPAYDALATPWMLAVTARPVAVVDATGADDVSAAVRFAAAHGLQVSVQATGHGATDQLAGTLLVHTGRLDQCVVHPEGWARVGAGVKWKRVIEQAAPYGLAPLSGSTSDVGVVGYTTGGGVGPMARTFGAASDRVRAFDVVTGDGVLRRVTPTEHPDLYWGLRGGKGALGIVTAIEVDLVPVAEFYGGALYFDGKDAPAVLHAWREWSTTLPAQGTTSFALLQLPPLPFVPEPLAGRPTVSVRLVWTGDEAQGAALAATMRAAAPVVMDDMRFRPYAEIDAVHADPVDPMPAHLAAAALRELPAQALDTLLAIAGADAGSPQVIVEVRQLGGALDERTVPSAFSPQGAGFVLQLIGMQVPPIAEAVTAHAHGALQAMAPWAHEAALPNFSPPVTPELAARCYPPAVLARLRDLAAEYDPAGVLVAGQALRG